MAQRSSNSRKFVKLKPFLPQTSYYILFSPYCASGSPLMTKTTSTTTTTPNRLSWLCGGEIPATFFFSLPKRSTAWLVRLSAGVHSAPFTNTNTHVKCSIFGKLVQFGAFVTHTNTQTSSKHNDLSLLADSDFFFAQTVGHTYCRRRWLLQNWVKFSTVMRKVLSSNWWWLCELWSLVGWIRDSTVKVILPNWFVLAVWLCCGCWGRELLPSWVVVELEQKWDCFEPDFLEF